MSRDKTEYHLWALAAGSYGALAVGVLLPIVAHLEGKEGSPLFGAFLFAGLIGVSAYQLMRNLVKRVSDLERR